MFYCLTKPHVCVKSFRESRRLNGGFPTYPITNNPCAKRWGWKQIVCNCLNSSRPDPISAVGPHFYLCCLSHTVRFQNICLKATRKQEKSVVNSNALLHSKLHDARGYNTVFPGYPHSSPSVLHNFFKDVIMSFEHTFFPHRSDLPGQVGRFRNLCGGTQTLQRCSLLSNYRKILRYTHKCNLVYAHKKHTPSLRRFSRN
jgi:hypothetical protein